MIEIKKIKLKNGVEGEELAELIFSESGITAETQVELMEVRINEYHKGYYDYFLRIDGTADLIAIRGVGFDPDYIRVWFKQDYFKDSKGHYYRCERLAKTYKLDIEFVYSFSDSAGVISDLLKRMKRVKMPEEYRQALLGEANSDAKRKLLKKVLGENLSRRARIATKKTEQIEKVAEFVANF